MDTPDLRQHIESTLNTLRKSERKVAEYILEHQQEMIHLRVADIAQHAEVSEPTVIRFCRAVGCSGFQDFKLKLAQELASSSVPRFSRVAVTEDDSTTDLSKKVFDGAIDALLGVRDELDMVNLERAILTIANTPRLEFFGFGASGAVAIDAFHKFFRLQLSVVSHSDHHLQNMSAASMKAGDVVVGISHSGRTKALLNALAIAKSSGATVISICPEKSPLAELADISINVEVEENIEIYTPMFTRLAHLVVIDTLAIGVAQQKGQGLKDHLLKLKQGLRNLRL